MWPSIFPSTEPNPGSGPISMVVGPPICSCAVAAPTWQIGVTDY
jgi:hypothetical protein